MQLQKEKDAGKILVKDNVEMKSKINTEEIIVKQKKQEEKERKNKLNEIKKSPQQTKHLNIEKENNIKTMKKVARREGYLGEASERSKNPKLTPRNKSTQTTK